MLYAALGSIFELPIHINQSVLLKLSQICWDFVTQRLHFVTWPQAVDRVHFLPSWLIHLSSAEFALRRLIRFPLVLVHTSQSLHVALAVFLSFPTYTRAHSHAHTPPSIVDGSAKVIKRYKEWDERAHSWDSVFLQRSLWKCARMCLF